MSSSPGEPFEKGVVVAAEDLDEREHVNNVVYLRWVQDIAMEHWRTLTPTGEQRDLAWVALRHEIDYLAPAFEGDELRVRTWVGRAEGLSFERHTEILGKDGIVRARARTIWCPVDATTGRPRRVTSAIRNLFSA